MLEPTELEEKYIEFIRIYWETNGYAPAIREIAANFAVSEVNAKNRVLNIVRKGKLKMEPNKSRTVRLA